MTNFTPLNTPLKQVLMQVSDDSALKWPNKLKSDPNKCLRDKYCHFFWDHGHDTSECYDLKQSEKLSLNKESYSSSLDKGELKGTQPEVQRPMFWQKNAQELCSEK